MSLVLPQSYEENRNFVLLIAEKSAVREVSLTLESVLGSNSSFSESFEMNLSKCSYNALRLSGAISNLSGSYCSRMKRTSGGSAFYSGFGS